jgi:hypothetical protein
MGGTFWTAAIAQSRCIVALTHCRSSSSSIVWFIVPALAQVGPALAQVGRSMGFCYWQAWQFCWNLDQQYLCMVWPLRRVVFGMILLPCISCPAIVVQQPQAPAV